MIKTVTETTLNIPAFINKIAADFGNLLTTPSGKEIDRYIHEAKDSKEKECYGRLYLICREFLKNNPDNLHASLDLLEVYLRVDQLDAARRILEKLYSKYSKSSIYESCPKSIFYPMLKAVRFFFEINKFSKNLVIIS